MLPEILQSFGRAITLATPKLKALQSGAADRSLGFEDEDLRSSPGWWAATVATYCPSRPGELLKSSSSKPSERFAAPLCRSVAAYDEIPDFGRIFGSCQSNCPLRILPRF